MTRAKDLGSSVWTFKSWTGRDFAFRCWASFSPSFGQGSQRRARRSGSTGELLSGLIVVAIVAGAFARAGSRHDFSFRFNRDNQTSKRV